ncbi:hypothetical protein DU504_07215 [Haloplanus salinus]|jgi:uncharacterized membrane protein YagU involved in acid resistance|uniref:Histidine kinase n=1 Tax=Haloplanus salinus TaxID=1126245 RepID=A0A368N981_9EURY|nr:hypothetical protein [Haloplanus salinus]RCU47107.1 hypothetical protein DU504_07215 [Haloplanus salinus]
MSTITRPTSAVSSVTSKQVAAGAAGGFVGSILFGLIMMYVIPAPILEMAIPAMYGIEGPALLAGWAIHQFHGVVLGIAYVGLVQSSAVRETARDLRGSLVLGVAYGVLATLVLAVLVMPIWLGALGFAGAPPFPNLSFPGTLVSTVGHIVYAVPVAVGYALSVR